MFNAFIVVLFFASIFSFINAKFLKLPSTIGLMLQATILAAILFLLKEFVPNVYSMLPHFERTLDFRDVLMNVILSFLLFAGAMHIDLEELRNQRKSVFLFATLGVLISTILIGYATFYILAFFGVDIPILYAFLFGAVVSPTDPIAVLGILKMYNVRKDIQMKIEGESLFNDGIGIVVFVTILHMIKGGGVESITVSEIAILFAREAIGGIGFGLFLGVIGYIFLKNIDHNPKTDIMITLVIATAGYSAANFIEVSGALAMVSAGLYIGNKIHKPSYSDESRNYINVFWDVLDEILNGILFVMIGFFALKLHVDHFSGGMVIMMIIAIVIIRFIAVIVPFYLIKQKKNENNWKVISVLSWGGLRGGLGIALALSIPPEHNGDLFVFLMFCIAAFSIIVQGLTIGKLVQKVGLNEI